MRFRIDICDHVHIAFADVYYLIELIQIYAASLHREFHDDLPNSSVILEMRGDSVIPQITRSIIKLQKVYH